MYDGLTVYLKDDIIVKTGVLASWQHLSGFPVAGAPSNPV